MRNTTHSIFENFALSVPHAKPGYGKRSGPLGQARPLQLISVSVLGGLSGGVAAGPVEIHAPPGLANQALGALSGSWGFNGSQMVLKGCPSGA